MAVIEIKTEALPEERVLAGLDFLDERVPGWGDKIDLGKLDMADGRNCVLGQLGDCFALGMRALQLSDDDVARLGFFAAHAHPWSLDAMPEWATLTDLWRNRIEARRES